MVFLRELFLGLRERRVNVLKQMVDIPVSYLPVRLEMFNYEMPCGGFRTITTYKDGNIVFDPPVYEQRYCAVIEILGDSRWDKQMKKIVDFGCAEMRLLTLLRRLENVEHILEVDIDEALLKKYKIRAKPLVSDYLKRRELPLRVNVLHGSIADPDDELQNVDAVIALEIIEHVYDDVLEKIPQNIFGFIQPKLAIFSTPNVEFNVLFGEMESNGFRHHDHKFEWTREEFRQWCSNIVATYSNYDVSFMGVGEAPNGRKDLGFVTQIALFVRKDLINMELPENQQKPNFSDHANLYKTIHKVDFPQKDVNSIMEPADEIKCQINRLIKISSHHDQVEDVYKIPISVLLDHTAYLSLTDDAIYELILKLKDVEINDDFVVVRSILNR